MASYDVFAGVSFHVWNYLRDAICRPFFHWEEECVRGMAMGQGRIKPRLFPVLFSGNGSPQLIQSLLFHIWNNFEGGSLRKKMFQSNCQNVPLLSTPKPENLLSFNYPTDIYCIIGARHNARTQSWIPVLQKIPSCSVYPLYLVLV